MKTETSFEMTVSVLRTSAWWSCVVGPFVLLAFLLMGTATADVKPLENGGYPWANAPIGSEDDLGIEVRVCASYAAWRVRQDGVSVERINSGTDIRSARERFETVDTTPAPGALALYQKANHVAYVESVDWVSNTMVSSDYNGSGGSYSYGIETVPIPGPGLRERTGLQYIHYELPPVAGGKFIGAKRMYGQRRMLSNRTLFEEKKYIMSPNERYVMMLDPTGTLAVYDRNNDFQVKWSLKVTRRAELSMSILDNRPRVRLVLEEVKGWKRLKSWYVGAARKIQLNNTGGLSGIRGGKVVWRAANLAQVPKVARAAEKRRRVSR